jgi:hypothetical protein
MSKNFETIHVGGVYRAINGNQYYIIPKEENNHRISFIMGDHYVGVRACRENQSRWMPYRDDGTTEQQYNGREYDLIEYLGEYDREKFEIIPYCDGTSNQQPEPLSETNEFLVSEKVIETSKLYQNGIFLAKTVERNGCEWIHFGTKSEIDETDYGYTKEEFVELMALLNSVYKDFVTESD